VSDPAVLEVEGDVWIPRAELTYRASRSGGPGGQHVNTSSTRVELSWDVAHTPSLTEEQRARVLGKLANRINSDGVLLLTEGGSRSQHQNRDAVTERFRRLLGQALRVPKPRKKTRPPRASREARLQAKKQRSEVKRLRGPAGLEEL
jgi:ribosome-associated protein